ncbi:ABC transporter permease [Clostridium sp. SHJSY1]|uniref:ABC transporter permease n=1 Tax=Clostridium sp. SHJSY1 TaxID=2942483 RepID=UPI0028750F03|nr:ABC transporter permease [Clostridium sp. SHJSY1]MDS0526150.1 ABC transporter permease [Clostridium sp. SHJSY1]
MYVKLALNNARRSIKDYLIYFITLTICVSLFYAFMSLSSSSYELITEDSVNFDFIKKTMKYATYIVTALLVLLIGYVNRYMIKRRKREFATYILLGIPQKNVAFMFFIETLVMGIISIVFGIFVGTLFSQFVTAIILMTVNQQIIFSFKLYIDTVMLTFLFFIGMFCIIGFFNIRILSKTKLINMINDEKKTEFQFKRSKNVYVFVFSVAVLLYLTCGICFYRIIKVLNDKSLIKGNENEYVIIGIISFIAATYTLFYSMAYIVIAINQRWKNYKYEYTNLFLIGAIVSKIKTAPILMATISLTFLGAALSFALTLIMSQWGIGYLENRIPFDMVVSSKYYTEEKIQDIPKIDYREIRDYISSENCPIKSYCQVEEYFINNSDFRTGRSKNMPILAIGLSDFNELREMLGYDKVELNKNEFTMQWDKTIKDSEINDYLEKNPAIKIKEKELSISSNSFYKESLGSYIYIGGDALIVLPDEQCVDLTLANTALCVNTEGKISFDKSAELEEEYIPEWFKKNYTTLFSKADEYNTPFVIRLKVSETNEVVNAFLGMRIIGIYVGTVLLMISLTILALQQLSDSIEHKGRFNTLRKLGIDDGEISKLVLKQISIYFILPIIIAIIGFVIFIRNFEAINSERLSLYVGDKALTLNIVLALILIIVVYMCYFLATYYSFKQNIKGK